MRRLFILFLGPLLFLFLQSVCCLAADDQGEKSAVSSGEVHRMLDAYQKRTPGPVNSVSQWSYEEQDDPVKRSLEVFRKKNKDPYWRKIWFEDENGNKKIYIEYLADKNADDIVFTPDKGHAFFIKLTPLGESLIYGLDLGTQNQYVIAAADQFNIMNCPNKKSYIVIEDNGETHSYQIYDIAGEQSQTLTNMLSPDQIRQAVCY